MTRRTIIGLLMAGVIIPIRQVWGQAESKEDIPFRKLTFGMMSQRLLREVNLTPGQRSELAAHKKALAVIYETHKANVSRLRKRVADELFLPSTSDRSASVASNIAKIADGEEDMMTQGFLVGLAIKQILRPDQLEVMASVRQELLSKKGLK